MKYIANILTDKPFISSELYNIVSDKNMLIDDIPTLIIGWEYTKKIYPNASILNWEINDNTFWTYGKREKRSKYEENIENFKKLSLEKFVKSVKYIFYNLLTISEDDKTYLSSLLRNSNGTVIYIKCDMVYILDKIKGCVIGFSLRDIDFLNGNRSIVLSCIFKNKNNIIIDNINNLSLDVKTLLNKCLYVIPFLYS